MLNFSNSEVLHSQHVFQGGGEKVRIAYRHLWREEWTEQVVTHFIRPRFCLKEKESCGFFTGELDQR